MNNIGAYANLPLAATSSPSANVKGESDDPLASADPGSGSFLDALNGISQSSDDLAGPKIGADQKMANANARGITTIGSSQSAASLSRLRLPQVPQADLTGSSFIEGKTQTQSSAAEDIAESLRSGVRQPEVCPASEAADAELSLSAAEGAAPSSRPKEPSGSQLKTPPTAWRPGAKTAELRGIEKINERNTDAETAKAAQAAPVSNIGQMDEDGQSPIKGLSSGALRNAPGVSASSIDHKRRTSDERSESATASASSTAPGVVAAPLTVPIFIASSLKALSETPDTTGRAPLSSLSMAFSKDNGGIEESSHKDVTPMKVDVIGQATHFAPVVQLSASQQIVGAVVPMLVSFGAARDAGGVSTLSSAAASVEPAAGAAVPQSPVKTLDLQLEPESLGAVTIKLNLSSAGLEVDVQASQAMTANLLEKDKHALSEGLTDAGYVVSAVDISAVPQNAASAASAGAGDQTAAQNMPGGGGYDGASQNNAGSQSQGGSAQNAPSRHYQQGLHEASEPARASARRSAGGLYI